MSTKINTIADLPAHTFAPLFDIGDGIAEVAAEAVKQPSRFRTFAMRGLRDSWKAIRDLTRLGCDDDYALRTIGYTLENALVCDDFEDAVEYLQRAETMARDFAKDMMRQHCIHNE